MPMKARAASLGSIARNAPSLRTPCDVGCQEFAQPEDAFLLEGSRQLVTFERGVEDQAQDRGVGLDAAEQCQCEHAEDGAVVARRGDRFDRFEEFGRRHPLVEDRGVHRFLAREVAVEGGLGDPDLRGDVAGGGAVETVAAEELGRLAEDLGAALVGGEAAGSGRGGGRIRH